MIFYDGRFISMPSNPTARTISEPAKPVYGVITKKDTETRLTETVEQILNCSEVWVYPSDLMNDSGPKIKFWSDSLEGNNY